MYRSKAVERKVLLYFCATEKPNTTGIIEALIAFECEHLQILREHNCAEVLLSQLRSSSLTIVSNACGTLWNLSARNAQDQRLLLELGAVPQLRGLVRQKSVK